MPAFPLIVKLIESPPVAMLSARVHKRAMTAAHKAMGAHWSDKILPGRFRPFSAGHAPRKKSTIARKRKKGRGNVDLVDSGLAQSIALQSHFVRAFPTRASVVIPGPSYFRINFRNPNRINLAREALYVTELQQEKLGNVAGEEYERQLKIEAKNAPQNVRTFKG